MKHNLKPGDKINFFTVKKIVKIKKGSQSMGNGALLMCECGEEVGPIPVSRLYKRGKRPGVKSCKSCGYKRRGESQRLYTDGQAKHAVFSRYKVAAQRRNIEWNLDRDLFFEVALLPCYYCGKSNLSYAAKPKTSPWQEDFYYTGIDRIDSSKGYSKDNIQPCCRWCNMAKSNRKEKEFLDWIEVIHDRKEKGLL